VFDLGKKPLLLIGGGCKGAKLRTNIPAVSTWNALDVVTPDLPNYAGVVGTYGGPGRNLCLAACDVLIAVGCRISGRITGGMPFAPQAKKYLIDKETQPGFVFAEMDGRDYLDGLGEQELDPEWVAQCKEWAKLDPVNPGHFETFHHYGFVRRLSERLPANAIVVYDTGGSAVMMGHCFKGKQGQTILSSNGNSPMGFAFCGALGAWVADPSRPVICLIGDGGFNMNLQEIQTMVNYGCDVKVFILNNHCYGNTKLYQDSNKIRQLACGPDGYTPPDFCQLALAYKVRTARLESWHYFDSIYESAMQNGPIIVDVVHHDFYQYYPRISRFDQLLHEQDLCAS
jgi:acetolactate synthase I/II/III large subunit